MKKALDSKKAWRLGLGAGLLGAVVVALKYAVRQTTKLRVPDTISPAVFATKVLHTSLGEVVYHESGTGETLIFVHDICCGGSSYEWSKVYREFANTHRVIALDLVGFGESSRPQRHFSALDYVRMLAEFVRAIPWGVPPVFVASGVGAGLCTYLASEYPELVSRLLLFNPNGGDLVHRAPISAFSKLLYRTPLLARFIYRNHLSTRASVAQGLRRMSFLAAEKVSEENIEVYATCAQQPGAEHGLLSWLSGRLIFDFERCLQRTGHLVRVLESNGAATALENPERVVAAITAELGS